MLYLVPLFLSASLLFLSNGSVGTLLPLRGSFEGMDLSSVGWMGSTFTLGFLFGSVYGSSLLMRVGHVRGFSIFASLSSVLVILHVLYVDEIWWIFLRFWGGFCFSGQFVIIESWLNEMTPTSRRGRTLGVYRLVDLSSVVVGQFILAIYPPEGFVIFMVLSILYSLSLLPICISIRRVPDVGGHSASISAPLFLLRVSPLAALGVFVTGLTNSAFRTLGPVLGDRLGMDTEGVAIFISSMLLGGALFQLPFGWMSDKFERRAVITFLTIGAMGGGLFMSYTLGDDLLYLFIGASIFGGCSLSLYTICVAHANDFVRGGVSGGDYITLSAGILMTYGIGATIGPLFATKAIEIWSDVGFFIYLWGIHGCFVLLSLWRIIINRRRPSGALSSFIPLPRTSIAIYELSRRIADTGGDDEEGRGKTEKSD